MKNYFKKLWKNLCHLCKKLRKKMSKFFCKKLRKNSTQIFPKFLHNFSTIFLLHNVFAIFCTIFVLRFCANFFHTAKLTSQTNSKAMCSPIFHQKQPKFSEFFLVKVKTVQPANHFFLSHKP